MRENSLGPRKLINRTFGERISLGSVMRRKPTGATSQRWVFLFILATIFPLIAFARLFDLQLIRGSYFQALSEGNRIRRIPIKAPRGEILDRSGRALARNIPIYKIATFSEGGVVIDTEEVSREEALRIQISNPELETKLLVDAGREYPLGEKAAHVVGYVNEAAPEEIGVDYKCQKGPYQLGDLVGRMGVEAQYECILRGRNGEELIEVDTRGRLVRRLGKKEPVPGQTITLALDSALQEIALEALENAPNEEGTHRAKEDGIVVRGAVVVQNPNNGEILALASAPSFNPAKISEKYSEWATDENMPFFDRAVSGAYPPGSTFKIVSVVAGLQESKIDREFEYEDKGFISVNNFSYRNWYFTQYGRTEGLINIVRAITRSTDTFFYKVGEMVGVEKLAAWAQNLGLGEKTGIDLPSEVGGLVPTPEWKESAKGERWFLGNTYHMSIGQGDISATPLQVNGMTSVIASGGKLCVPHLIIMGESQKFQIPSSKFQMDCHDVGINPETVELITQGMIGACSPGGTAFPLFNFEPQVACKTGTAEFAGSDKTHAWLTAFAPAATDSAELKPEIVVTALVEAGGEGSTVAAPVVKEVLDYWFYKR